MPEASTRIPAVDPAPGESFFVPDLCRAQAVFLLVLLAEIIAVVFTLVRSGLAEFDWTYLALVSLFLQLVALVCAALLCMLRAGLARLSTPIASMLCLSLILMVVAMGSLGAGWLLDGLSGLAGYQPDWYWIGQNLLLAFVFGGMILRHFYLQHQWRSHQQAELQARIAALQARIRPHFLFNSLNAITSMIAVDPEKAEAALLDLADLFRATLQVKAIRVPFSDEESWCRNYLHIEQLRLGDRLQVTWHMDPGVYRFHLPPLLLQPILENAVYHGIQRRAEGGSVTVNGEVSGTTLRLEILNPLAAKPGQHGSQVGLDNVRARLFAIYGEKAVVDAGPRDGFFRVRLSIPATLPGIVDAG